VKNILNEICKSVVNVQRRYLHLNIPDCPQKICNDYDKKTRGY